MRTIQSIAAAAILVSCVFLSSQAAQSEEGGLVSLLTDQLKVSEDQAAGGAGAIFKTAKGNLTEEEFTQVEGAVPEMDSLLAAAPEPEKSGDLMGKAMSMAGDKGGSVGDLAGLAGSFKNLGMGADMIDQFTPVIMDYVQSKGGDMVKNLLVNALK